MQHIAIMRKSWGLTSKILSGEKTIESRWYKHRIAPWGKINPGDTIFFKDSGEPVTVRATVVLVMQFADLTPYRVAGILRIYGQADGIAENNYPIYYERFQHKRYCLLIFIKEARRIEPFVINKNGFGTMSAWITAPSVLRLKV